MVAAVSSPLLFATGALVPLLPWFLTSGTAAVAASAAVTALASLLVGASAPARAPARPPGPRHASR